MPVTLPLWVLAVAVAATAFIAYTFGFAAGKSSGKVEAYEQENVADADD